MGQAATEDLEVIEPVVDRLLACFQLAFPGKLVIFRCHRRDTSFLFSPLFSVLLSLGNGAVGCIVGLFSEGKRQCKLGGPLVKVNECPTGLESLDVSSYTGAGRGQILAMNDWARRSKTVEMGVQR